LPWTAILPVAVLVAAAIAVLWFDITEGGEPDMETFIGDIGTPVRHAFVSPTAVPPGAEPTPRATTAVRGGIPAGAPGTPEERDETRRQDLLVLLNAAAELKVRDGAYPDTNNNVQTLCSYRDQDQACKLTEILGEDLPLDPLGDGIRYGYWYSSDGENVRFYAAMEGDIPDEQKCETTDAELSKRANLICIEGS
jgi:hypothetical protein